MRRDRRTDGTGYGWAKLSPLAMAAAMLSGCSSGGGTDQFLPASALPTAPAATSVTTYVGTQAPGYWNFVVNETTDVFSYQAMTASSVLQSGSFGVTSGLLNLGSLDGVALGKAAVQPAGGALLRPGDDTNYPVPMIQQSACFPLTGKLRYIYAGLAGQSAQGTGGSTEIGAYGTFVVSTGTDGASWNFEDLHLYALPKTGSSGFAIPAGTDMSTDPLLFSAACANANGQGTVTADSTAPFQASPAGGSPLIPTFDFNPGGGFIEDRGAAPAVGPASWIGFAMPSAPVSASGVLAGSYVGFVYEDAPGVTALTQPVSFPLPAAGSKSLVGGTFPNDDLTQAAGNEYTITLGTQDTTLNGVFPNAQLVALDVNGNCALVAPNDPTVQIGANASGQATCTAAGVAVVGQLNGKYVIYFTSSDGTETQVDDEGYEIQFYLYQQ